MLFCLQWVLSSVWRCRHVSGVLECLLALVKETPGIWLNEESPLESVVTLQRTLRTKWRTGLEQKGKQQLLVGWWSLILCPSDHIFWRCSRSNITWEGLRPGWKFMEDHCYLSPLSLLKRRQINVLQADCLAPHRFSCTSLQSASICWFFSLFEVQIQMYLLLQWTETKPFIFSHSPDLFLLSMFTLTVCVRH